MPTLTVVSVEVAHEVSSLIHDRQATLILDCVYINLGEAIVYFVFLDWLLSALKLKIWRFTLQDV